MRKCLRVIAMMSLLFFANKAISQNAKPKETYPNGITLIAWNEDTTYSVEFALTKDKKFYYTISKEDSLQKKAKYYYGSFEQRSDTLFLKYNTALLPENFTRFLIIEASGHYLIQSRADKGRIFLRIQKLSHRINGYIPQ